MRWMCGSGEVQGTAKEGLKGVNENEGRGGGGGGGGGGCFLMVHLGK